MSMNPVSKLPGNGPALPAAGSGLVRPDVVEVDSSGGDGGGAVQAMSPVAARKPHSMAIPIVATGRSFIREVLQRTAPPGREECIMV